MTRLRYLTLLKSHILSQYPRSRAVKVNRRYVNSEASHQPRRIFSGIQPTGVLHIGNYLGAVKNWVALQHESETDVLYSIVDLHSITVPWASHDIRQSIRSMVISLLACGLDPQKSAIFQQSKVPGHTELAWILGCLTPTGHLNRMHQWKSKLNSHREQVCLGLYSYPVLMSSDILLYKASHVPIGDDQLQHLELARELSRLFNNKYGELFPSPQPILVRPAGGRAICGSALSAFAYAANCMCPHYLLDGQTAARFFAGMRSTTAWAQYVQVQLTVPCPLATCDALFRREESERHFELNWHHQVDSLVPATRRAYASIRYYELFFKPEATTRPLSGLCLCLCVWEFDNIGRLCSLDVQFLLNFLESDLRKE